MLEQDGKRYCDRCGVPLTKENNKCGYEICDTCNDYLENYMREKNEREIERVDKKHHPE